MGKIHLLLKKEEINEEKIKGKIAVVFDVLLATSTMTVGLHLGAKEVIPVNNGDEALIEAKEREQNSFLLVGEYEGRTIEGFLDPMSFRLQEEMAGKSMIISSTNGTVAVRKSSAAEKVYICSLLNGQAVADRIREQHTEETIIIVCSGSSDSFCLEDFYGAGYLLDCLIHNQPHEWEITDSARAALLFYQEYRTRSTEVLCGTRVGQMIADRGFQTEIDYVAQCGVLSIVPSLKGKSILVS